MALTMPTRLRWGIHLTCAPGIFIEAMEYEKGTDLFS